MRAAIATALVAALLVACSSFEKPEDRRKHNEQYRFSLVIPKGWTFFDDNSDSCLATLGARKGACRIYACAAKRPKDIITARSRYINCEQLKDYVTERLKGQNAECSPGVVLGRRTYDLYYMRRIQNRDGVKSQFVRQSFLPFGDMLYTVTAYAMGDTDQAARDAFEQNADPILRSAASLFIHLGKKKEK